MDLITAVALFFGLSTQPYVGITLEAYPVHRVRIEYTATQYLPFHHTDSMIDTHTFDINVLVNAVPGKGWQNVGVVKEFRFLDMGLSTTDRTRFYYEEVR